MCANESIRGLAGMGLAALAIAAALPASAQEPAKPPAAQEQAATPATARPAPKLAAEAKGKPAAKPAHIAPAECVRTGQRVIAALARDDTGAATQFFAFYNAFKCSQPHLIQAFGCLVKLQAANPSISNPSPDLVNQCWGDPSSIPEVPPPPPPAEPQR
jgi:hypothetical protein